MDNTVGRLQSLFPPHQLDVIIGSLLGDGRLECRSKGIRVFPITARLRIQHGEKQKGYVFWKYQILNGLVSRGPRRIMVWYDKKREKYHYSWYFHTRSSEKLGLFHQYFYREGVKILPDNIFRLITPRVLAVWFMDDGSFIGNGLTINTHCFPPSEQRKIIKFLTKRFQTKAKIVPDRLKFKIFIPYNESENFIRTIRSYIIPTIKYKICNPRNDSSYKKKDRSILKLL